MMKTSNELRMKAGLQLKDSDASRKVLSMGDKAKDRLETERLAVEIGQMQTMLYAAQQQKLLIVLQGMDTAGKDRSVASMFAQCNLMGLHAKGFKAPSAAELAQDFLWRVHPHAPARGQIAVFNRSHYEDVLVPLVHGGITAQICQQRYQHIREFERMLAENGTRIVKIFLHISYEEQTGRLKARMRDPQKQWKFDPSDLAERPFWQAYQNAYQDAMQSTDADHAPWYIVPADSKTQRNLLVTSLVHEALSDMQLSFPAFRDDLAAIQLE